MTKPLEQSLIRIQDQNGETVGAGFIVAENLVVTCAHVVEAAGAGPGGELSFKFFTTGSIIKATVSPEYWSPSDEEDVAILYIGDSLPEGIQPILLGSTGGTSGHSFETLGFPDVPGVGELRGYGKIGGAITIGNRTVLQLTGTTEITPGFSGAPVLDAVTRRVVGMVTAITMPDQFGRLTETAFITPAETIREICLELQLSDICPYQSLDAFTEEDTEFYYGRQRVIDRLLTSLRREPRFLAVLGPSGCGKSSLVQAGLIPQLRQGKIPGSERWGIITTRPTSFLIDQLNSQAPETFSESFIGYKHWLEEYTTQKHLVLIVDQFEELLIGESRLPTQEYIYLLEEILEVYPEITLIIVMRDDFYSRFTGQAPKLAEWLGRGLVNIPLELEEDELTTIVEDPASDVGLEFETGLVETIVADAIEVAPMAGEIDRVGRSTTLPLLEFALTQIWEKRQEGRLTHEAYNEIGGVLGGLTRWSNSAYYKLDDEVHHLARRILTDLVHLGDEREGLHDSRRRRELASLSRNADETEKVSLVIRQLVDSRLLVTYRDRQSGKEVVEIVHEALLREWALFREWLREDRRFLVWRQEIERRAKAWVDTNPENEDGRDRGKLLRGGDLAIAEEWIDKRRSDLNHTECEYIEASISLMEQEAAEREAQRKRELEQTQNLLRTQRQRTYIFAAGLIAAIILVLVALYFLTEASQQSRLSRAGQLSAQAQVVMEQYPQRSLLLAIEALYNLRSSDPRIPRSEIIFRDSYTNFGGIPLFVGNYTEVTKLAFSPDARWLAIGSSFGDIRLWDVTDPTAEPILLEGHTNWVATVAFSPDGRWLASGSGDDTVRLWDVQDTTAEPTVLLGHESWVSTVAFSPDGRWLASGSGDDTVRLWDVQDTTAEPTILLGHEDLISTLAFSPDGNWLASGSSDNTIRLLDVQDTSSEPTNLSGHEGPVNALAFSPDGRWLASGSSDNTIRLWDVQDPTLEPSVLRGNEGWVNTLAFSPDGRLLASGGSDSTIRLWDIQDPTSKAFVRRGHEDEVYTLAFSPDGRWLASGSGDKTVRLWDVEDPVLVSTVLRGHDGGVTSLAYSSDGSWLASSGREDRIVRLWDVEDPTSEPTILWRHGIFDIVKTLAFSPDGRWLASGSMDNTVRLWDVRDPTAVPILLEGHTSWVENVAFSPDGYWLASGGRDSTIRLWDIHNPTSEPSLLRGHEDEVNTLAFSPDGRWLASGGSKSTILLWDVEDPTSEPTVLGEHEDRFDDNPLAFSPDGRWLASVSSDGTVQLWDVEDPTSEPTVLLGHYFGVNTLAFSLDGRWLASGGSDSTIRLQDIQDPTSEPIILRGHEDGVNTLAFSPDGSWLASGSNDWTIRLWDVQDPTLEPAVLRGHEGWVNTLDISPDGRWLASGSYDSTIRLWNLDIESLITKACQSVGRNLTSSEWDQYFPGDQYRRTCLQWPEGK